MGLHTGFKSECITKFPDAWSTASLKHERDLVHIFDGMCVFHRFIPNDDDDFLSDIDQLSEFFVNVFMKEILNHGGGEVILVFDITEHLPSTKSDELSKRNSCSSETEIQSHGDLSRGILPRPWNACLSDRQMRMEVCDRLCDALIETMNSRYAQIGFSIYGWKSERFFFYTNSRLKELSGLSDVKVFGEADISMAYMTHILVSNPVCIHTVDTDLIAISCISLGSKDKNTYVCLSHHDVKSGQRVSNISSTLLLNESIRKNARLSPEDFFMICMLQGTDFVERLIKRGSWKSLFDYVMHADTPLTLINDFNSPDMSTLKGQLQKILFNMSSKTVAASDGKKRRKIEMNDISINEYSLHRIIWNFNYWKFAIESGYEPIREKISSGWREVSDRVAEKLL